MYQVTSDFEWMKLYSENKNLLRNFFRQRISNEADCEDLQQELFIRVHRLDPKSKIQDPKAYLFRIALNLINDLLRQRQRHHANTTPISELPDLDADAYTAESQVADRQQLILLEQAIATLPPKCREAFLLRKIDDKSPGEVAEIMGISQNMVEKHLRKALADCKQYLAQKSS